MSNQTFYIIIYLTIVATFCHCDERTTHIPSICSRCECLSISPFSVDCSDMNFKEVPELWKDLRVPWHFRLVGNSITEVTPFKEMHNLTGINLRFNKISSISDGAFALLPNLASLDLSHNLLTTASLTSNAFKGQYSNNSQDPLRSLTSLNLEFNSLHGLSRHVFKHLPYLTSLDISNNPFEDLSFTTTEALTDLQRLRKLDLSFARLLRLPNHFFSEFRDLNELDLSGNDFVAIPQEINYARMLQTLHLDDLNIESITAGTFWVRLGGTLQNLSISSNVKLVSVEEGAFANLTKLRTLNLSKNKKLSTIHSLAFTRTNNVILDLRMVCLQGNDLKYIPGETLRWKEIDYLDLQGNPWNCDCKMKWLATEIAPHIQQTNYDLSLNLTCAAPLNLKGKQMVERTVQVSNFSCEDERTGNFVMGIVIVGMILLLPQLYSLSFCSLKNQRCKVGLVGMSNTEELLTKKRKSLRHQLSTDDDTSFT